VRRPAVLLALVTAALFSSAKPAAAHPLGNFTVNRYAGLHVLLDEVRVLYVVDMAEIPTFQALRTIDANADGIPSAAELQSWAEATAGAAVARLSLTVDGTSVDLEIRSAVASMQPGQGGLNTLRLEAALSAPVDAVAGRLTFEDSNERDRIGWREITAAGEEGAALRDPTVPETSVSDALHTYPQDLLSSPLSITSMSARVVTDSSAGRPESTGVGVQASGSSNGLDRSARPLVEGGAFAALVANRGLPLMALGLLLAVALGAWHALLPGHGKTLIAAAVVGSSAQVRQTVVAASAVALMHSTSVILLGVLVLVLEQTFRPETLYPWLGFISGLVALGIGLHLMAARVRSWRGSGSAHGPARDGEHGTHRSGRHEHGVGEGHDHVHDHVHDESIQGRPGGFLSRRGIAALAFAGGILPAPSALVVMLAAVQLQRAAYGLSLVVAFSIGLAATLMIVGLSAARAGAALGRRSWVVARIVPVLSAAAIVAVGGFLAVRGVLQV
jgi:nickel/cobalt transporter (NicO) family protein